VERRKRYSRKFQRMAVERMRTCESVDELAKELGVTRRCFYKWRTKLEAAEPGEEAARPSNACLSQSKGNPPAKAVARREGDGAGFFEGCLAKSRGSTPAQQRLWREGIYEHIRELMPLQGRLSIENMCQLVALSRRGFYRSLRQQEPAEEETEVRSLIQPIALEHRRRYGYRRITAELHRRGVQVNRKKVARMMRDDNLLAIQPKRFVVTTNSKHKCEVYLNLAGRMTLTGSPIVSIVLWLAAES
jgi:helix-turn-helix protein/transposase